MLHCNVDFNASVVNNDIMWLLQIMNSIDEEQYIYIVSAKVFDILLEPYHGSKMQRTQLQNRLQEPSKDCKNKFPKISGRMGK